MLKVDRGWCHDKNLRGSRTYRIYLRGTLVNRTYGGHKNLYIHLFLPTIFGHIYYRPPYHRGGVLIRPPFREPLAQEGYLQHGHGVVADVHIFFLFFSEIVVLTFREELSKPRTKTEFLSKLKVRSYRLYETFFFFFFFGDPFCYPCALYSRPLPPNSTSDSGSHGGPSFPVPTTYGACLHFVPR